MGNPIPITQTSTLAVPEDLPVPLAESRLDELAKTLLDFKLGTDKRVEALEQTLRKKQWQLNLWRVGWLFTLLCLGGSLVGLSLWFRSQQLQLAEQVAQIATYTGPDSAAVQQLEALQGQVDALDQAIPEQLFERLSTAESKLTTVTQTVETLSQKQAQRQDVIAVLARALQAAVGDQPESAEGLTSLQNGPDTLPVEEPQTAATETE